MSFFSAVKWIAILVAVILFAGGSYYVMNLKANLAIAEENTKKLETAVKDQQQVIANKTIEIEQIQIINSDLSEKLIAAQEEVKKLNEKFTVSANGQSRDFGAITRVKPVLINKIINKATVKVNRCFELASGSEPKEGETNNECQDLIDNYNK